MFWLSIKDDTVHYGRGHVVDGPGVDWFPYIHYQEAENRNAGAQCAFSILYSPGTQHMDSAPTVRMDLPTTVNPVQKLLPQVMFTKVSILNPVKSL